MFRIYDNQEKKYVSEFIGQYYLNHEGKLFFVYAGDGEFDEIHKELDPSRYIVELSTGLKDKNGKEIFEGDVLTADFYPFKDEETDRNYVYVVEWIEEFASFQGILRCVNPNRRGISDGVNEQITQDDMKEFEVIGNIHDGENNE